MGFLPDNFTCDVCGAPKREVNHWWNIDLNGEIARQKDNSLVGNIHSAFVLIPFDPAAARQASIITVCGQTCAHKVVDEYLSNMLVASK